VSADLPVIPAALLQPAPARTALEQSTRRASTYWQQVGARLRRNPRAMIAMLAVALLVLGTLFGPLLWPVDPARLALGSAAEGPSRTRPALLIRAQGEWRVTAPVVAAAPIPAARLPAPQQLTVVSADTERVRLRWAPVAGALHYDIYRHTRAPRSRADLGLPIGTTASADQVSYEDGLQLRPRTYYYSVVASDGIDASPRYAVVSAQPQLAISWLEAQLQGLIPADADPAAWTQDKVLLPGHPLGTDYLGRDLLARLIYGARTSLFISVTAALLYVALGALYGAAAGFAGGWIDNAMMRVADFVVALPFLLFMILLRIAFGIGPGESGVLPLVVALLLLSWPATARLVRGQVLQLREEAYVSAARLAGGGAFYIILRHMLPNVLAVVLVALTFAIPHAIFTEAFLSFIGMGVTPPTPSWGSMSNDGIRNLLVHPAELMWPAVCISVTVLAFNMLGDALRDALDVNVQERL
jgi:oligopeptide transport system permease protein